MNARRYCVGIEGSTFVYTHASGSRIAGPLRPHGAWRYITLRESLPAHIPDCWYRHIHTPVRLVPASDTEPTPSQNRPIVAHSRRFALHLENHQAPILRLNLLLGRPTYEMIKSVGCIWVTFVRWISMSIFSMLSSVPPALA